MTTSTTIFGLLPMALDKSEGSNLWNPLAITVIGGLFFATPLTLVMVPSIYYVFEKIGKTPGKKISLKGFFVLVKLAAGKMPSVISGMIKRKPAKKIHPDPDEF